MIGRFGNGREDIWLLKTDSQGQEEWSQTYGGSGDDYGMCVQQTTDGGYVISGYANGSQGQNSQSVLIKTDSEGNTAPYGD